MRENELMVDCLRPLWSSEACRLLGFLLQDSVFENPREIEAADEEEVQARRREGPNQPENDEEIERFEVRFGSVRVARRVSTPLRT